MRSTEASGVIIDETVILEIGQVHPRFATALASLNTVGGLKDWAQISSYPAHLESSEVVNWLKPTAESKRFFLEYRKRRVAGAKLIIVEFTLDKADGRTVVRGKINNGFPDDLLTTQLEIELNKGKVVRWNVF
jgi:hypothetical protein